MSRILGLDLGEKSIGWAIVDTEKREVVDMGCRISQRTDRRNGQNRRRITTKDNSNKQNILRFGKCFKYIQMNAVIVVFFCLLIITGIFLLTNLHDWQFWFSLLFTVLITLLSILNGERR